MNYLANAFSLQMLETFPAVPVIESVSVEEIPEDVISCIGHNDTATVLSSILGRPVECNRQSITLKKEDTLYVAQITGGRLPEGATTLPDGYKFDFYQVKVNYAENLCLDKNGKVCASIMPCPCNCVNIF